MDSRSELLIDGPETTLTRVPVGEEFQTPQETPATGSGIEADAETTPLPSSLETPMRLATAIEKLIRTLPDEYGKKKEDAERRYLAALERSTAELRKLSRRRSLSDTESLPQSGISTPEQSEHGDSDIDDDTPDTQPVDVSHEGEVKYRTKRWIEERHSYVDVDDSSPQPAPSKTCADDGHALTWKTYEGRHGARKFEAVVHCPKLRQLLATELKHCPLLHWDQGPIDLQSDFLPLVHNWERLNAVANGMVGTDSCGTHLRRLLDLVRQSKRTKAYFDHLDRDIETIQFRDLAYLFPPGKTVFATVADQPAAFRVCGSAYSVGAGEMDLYCWTYFFDGKAFNRRPFRFTFDKWRGFKQIQMLRCYPITYHENKDIRKTLIDRGMRYRDCCIREKERRMFDYKGEISVCSERPEDVFGEEYAGPIIQASVLASLVARGGHRNMKSMKDDLETKNDIHAEARITPYNGHVVVDVEAYNSYGPQWPRRREPRQRPEPWKECECAKCQSNKELRELLKIKYDNVEQLPSGEWPEFEDEQALICPPSVPGYALATKNWVFMLIDKLQPLDPLSLPISTPLKGDLDSGLAFDKVVLPDDGEWAQTKELIRTLIQTHTNAVTRKQPGIPAPLQDLVEGKGQGVVILLYGASGVGKTLMAETVASYTGKPLLKVSVADIGLTPATVEKKLEELFHIATRWNAVLLFDEADILLEQRTDQAELTRNSIVSVFLKVLEYYEGILLLTTNRLMTFDIAVQSRVHLAVDFPKMTEKIQKRIMEMFLKQVAPEDMDEQAIRYWIRGYLNSDFNGRQIRNIFSSAINRARANGRKLLQEDIDVFWRRANDFQRYLAKHTSEVVKRQLSPNQIH